MSGSNRTSPGARRPRVPGERGKGKEGRPKGIYAAGTKYKITDKGKGKIL